MSKYNTFLGTGGLGLQYMNVEGNIIWPITTPDVKKQTWNIWGTDRPIWLEEHKQENVGTK